MMSSALQIRIIVIVLTGSITMFITPSQHKTFEKNKFKFYKCQFTRILLLFHRYVKHISHYNSGTCMTSKHTLKINYYN